MNKNKLCYELAQRTTGRSDIPETHHFHTFHAIGSGGFGAVFDAGYERDGTKLIRKVDRITETNNDIVRAFKILESVDYTHTPRDDKGTTHYVQCDGFAVHLSEQEAFRLQRSVNQYEALKVLRGEPHFPQIVPFGETGKYRQFFLLDGHLYVEFESAYIPGKNVRHSAPYYPDDSFSRCDTSHLPPQTLVKIIRDTCRGLKVLQWKKLVHRDVKPENLLLTDDFTHIIDFGCSEFYQRIVPGLNVTKDTKDLIGIRIGNLIFGSPGFIAPEILWGEKPTTHSDAWAAGVTFYQLITGYFPFMDYSDPHKTLNPYGARTINEDDILAAETQMSFSRFNTDLTHAIAELLQPEQKRRNLDEVIEEAEAILMGSKALERKITVAIPKHKRTLAEEGIPKVPITTLTVPAQLPSSLIIGPYHDTERTVRPFIFPKHSTGSVQL